MYAFHLFETEGHAELDVGCGVGIVRQLFVVVKAVVLSTKSQCLMPFHTRFFPLVEPIELGAGRNEELHFHLLELAHAEDKLARHNFVSECLSYLRDAKRHFHAARFLHVQVVNKDALCRFGAQINLAGGIRQRTHFGREHQVELANVGPILCSADGVYNLLVQDNLFQLFQVRALHGLCIAFVQCVALGLVFQNARIGLAEHGLVEAVAELLGGLSHLFVYLFLVFGNLVFYQHVGTIAFFRVAVVDKWVVESVHVSACFPDGWVHKDGRVDAHDVLVQQHHAFPPILLNVVFQFNAVLSVVVNGSQPIVNVAAGEHEPIFFAVRNYFLENVFLCHCLFLIYLFVAQSYTLFLIEGELGR